MQTTVVKDNRKGAIKTFKDLPTGEWFENGNVLYRVLSSRQAMRAFDGTSINFGADAQATVVNCEITILKE